MKKREATATWHTSISFSREEELASKLQTWIEDCTNEKYRAQLVEIQQQYIELLNTAQLLTRMGDRLQARLKAANESLAQKNEEIARYNSQLQQKNRELHETLEALRASQRRRKAATVFFLSTLTIFILTEIIEYYIENTGSRVASKWANFISIGLKAVVAVAFKPLEDLFEEFLARFVKDKKTS